MAILRVEKIRVVSLSQTALMGDIAIEHILIDRMPKPKINRFGTRPAEDGFFCMTMCGIEIQATTLPTYVTTARGKKKGKLQERRPCKHCRSKRVGGELAVRLLEPGEASGWASRDDDDSLALDF